MSDRIKRKRRLRRRASGTAIALEGPPHWAEKFISLSTAAGVEVPAFRSSHQDSFVGCIPDLRSKIEANPRLSKDLAFFQGIGWSREDFLWRLFHSADMQVGDWAKQKEWVLSARLLQSGLKDVLKAKKTVEKYNAMNLPPALTEIYHRVRGLPLQDEQLAKSLAACHEAMSWSMRAAREAWPRHKKIRAAMMRRDSFFEEIRARAGRYHAVRLHRLVNVARQIRRLPLIEQRAFVIWLNRLKAASRKNEIVEMRQTR